MSTHVLLDNLLDPLLLEVLELVLLQEQLHAGTTAKGLAGGVRSDGESTASSRLPDVLLVIVVLGGDLDTLGNKVGRVETCEDTPFSVPQPDTLQTNIVQRSRLTDTELSNHADIGTRAQSLHERLGTRLCDRTEVVDEVGLGHTDTGITDGEGLVDLVRDDTDVKILFGVELGRVGESRVTDLVESIGGVGLGSSESGRLEVARWYDYSATEERTHNQFTKEDLLVGVEGVDDQVQKLGDLGLEAGNIISPLAAVKSSARQHHRHSPKSLWLGHCESLYKSKDKKKAKNGGLR